MLRVVDRGILVGIKPSVVSGSVHSLRLSKVRVRVSLKGVTFYSYRDFNDRVLLA